MILGQGSRVDTVMLTRNVSTKPLMAFEIEPAALLSAQKEARNGGPQVIGYFHSHPNGVCEPSAQDAAQANCDGRYWVIVAGQQVSVWRVVEGGSHFGCFERSGYC